MEKDDLEYKKAYEKIRSESEHGLDTYVKYLSGGALVISLTFIGKILPSNPDYIYLIILAWVLLAISLIINFVSYLFTIENCNKTISDIDDENKNWRTGVSKRNKTIHFMNYASAIITIVGIIGITLFVSLNINNYG